MFLSDGKVLNRLDLANKVVSLGKIFLKTLWIYWFETEVYNKARTILLNGS